MTVKLLTEHNLELLSLKGGCTGSSESTLVKMPHYWKAHVAAHISCIGIIISTQQIINVLITLCGCTCCSVY